ncbi:anhydro-N-acetylmuramic acid kinase [Thalassolituus sp. LLYu03]|uniref:anhydro-N-acetylmuramic acid kinase n=1 Tax=Thalassolituus sp. LLYu03 TaxID=3421656 RepID=UPI003D2947EF
MSLYIGLMSGTSADGMDAALIDVSQGIRLLDALCVPYDETFRQQLREGAVARDARVRDIALLDRRIAECSVEAVQLLLKRNSLQSSAITAIGSHGHTLRHKSQPDGFSWQIGDPSWIAEHTGITCIADFRRRDVAAGGHGAPLVPAFHKHTLACQTPRMVLNIGGIANLTVLPYGERTLTGFDTGPGNALMDEWCQNYLHCSCDKGGHLAALGEIREDLLDEWLDHPYFRQDIPKSTGRELFNLAQYGDLSQEHPEDMLATFTELTVQSIVRAVRRYGHEQGELLVCGGGVHNDHLLKRLRQSLPQHEIKSTATAGVDPDWLEAMAFAWLAWRTHQGLSGNAPEVTGAIGERILGGIFPA